MITLYGIPNCDRVRAARQWLEQQEADYRFHDVRKDGLDRSQVQNWLTQLGMDTLVNRKSTTWRTLSPNIRNGLTQTSAIELILAEPTLLKRPLLETPKGLFAGFDETQYRHMLESERV